MDYSSPAKKNKNINRQNIVIIDWKLDSKCVVRQFDFS